MKVQHIDKFFSIRNAEDGTPEIDLAGYIGVSDEVNYPGVKNAIRELKNAGKTTCTLNINSGGGDMFEGLAIYDEIMQSGIKCKVRVVGMAASMASILAYVGDGLPQMTPHARLMFHKPQSGMYGESTSLREAADVADKLEKDIKKILTDRTGKPADEIEKWFQPGCMTWMTASEAINAEVAEPFGPPGGPETPQYSPVAKAAITNKTTDREAFEGVYRNVFSITNISDMKLNVTNRSNLKLGETPTEDEINTAITNQTNELVAVKNELKTIKEQRATEVKNRGKQLIQNAIDNKQILETERAQYEADYEANPELVERVINKLPKPTDIRNRINPDGAQGGGGGADDRSKWTVYDWQKNDLDGLARMKVENRAQYNKLYKDQGIEVRDED